MRVKQPVRQIFNRPTAWNVQPMQQQFDKGDDPDGDDPDKGGDDPDGDPDGDPDDDPDGDKPDGDPKPEEKNWKAIARQNERKLKAKDKEYASSVASIKKALGLKDDDSLSAEQLNDKLSKADQERREALIERDIMRHGREHGDTLLDSRTFMKKVSDLDPSDEDYSDDLKKLVKDEIKKRGLDDAGNGDDGSGKSTPKRNRSGRGTGSGDENVKQLTREDLKSLSPAEILEAQEKGQLVSLGLKPQAKKK